MVVKCDYCERDARLAVGAELYPRRPELATRVFWRCDPCGAHVGCHPGGTSPMGALANYELRKARSAAHLAFDPIWQNGRMKRRDAYYWLSRQLGVRWRDCHIGLFDLPQCQRVVEIMGAQ